MYNKVGRILVEKLKPFEIASVVDNKNVIKSSYQIDEMDPPNPVMGTGFPIQINLVTSQRLGAEEYKFDKVNAANEALTELLSTEIGNKDIGPNDDMNYKSTQISDLAIVQRPPSFGSATIKLAGDGATLIPLTVDLQGVRPLTPSSWSWLVTQKDAGDMTLYISVFGNSLSDKAVTLQTKVIPIKIQIGMNYLVATRTFLEGNWQWLAGTILIPLGLFAWRKRRNQKPHMAES